jgi:hypothetical protein
MANSTLCVSCAQLPSKRGSAAVKTMRCADCGSVFGVTSYGTPFRMEVARSKRILTRGMLTGFAVGGGLAAVALALIGMGMWTTNKAMPTARPADPPVANELARVPEVAVDSAVPHNIGPAQAKVQINHLITTIRNENAAGQDAFVLANMKRRPELQGMPFVMGAACRQDRVKAVSFQTSVSAVRDGLEMDSSRFAARDTTSDPHGPFWQTYMASTAHQGIATDHGIAALTQILAPERKTMRASLLERLKQSNRPEATRAIARSAIFDSDGDIRAAAVKALKDRPRAEYDEVLMHGLRYPLATVAKRSAQVMLALNRTDLLPNVAAVLDEAAPGDPAVQKVEGKPVHVVHELVRINHHRNCLLCHPPSQTGETFEVPGVIPIPGMAFPTSPKDAYGSAQSLGEPMVRADTTYLRQDFSVLMPVTGAAPWPEMQRFDFLVRTRVVEGKELAALQANIQARAADFLSDNHKAALKVLRDLSGEDAAPNAAAWQKVLAAKFQAPR